MRVSKAEGEEEEGEKGRGRVRERGEVTHGCRFQHVSCGGKAWGGGAIGVRRGRGYRGRATPTCMQNFEFQHVGLEAGEGFSGRGRVER